MPLRQPFLVGVDDQIQPEIAGGGVAERDHLAELPLGVDVQHRERHFRRIEGLAREVQQDARILADRVHQHRVAELGGDLAQDRHRLGFETAQMSR